MVAVAREDTLCGTVLYSVPMDDSMAAKLLLDAASESTLGQGNYMIPITSRHPHLLKALLGP